VSRKKIFALLGATVSAAVVAVAVPVLGASSASAAAPCASAWNSGAVYTNGMSASYNGDNWTAKWWTQGDTPGGSAGVWADQGACGGSGGGGGTGGGGGGTGGGGRNCNSPARQADPN
jgi:chitodextrinase